MEIELRNRTQEHVITFWSNTQDEELKRLFPFSVDSLEESLVLFNESLKADAQSFGKVIYVNRKYIGDIWCYGIDEKEEKMAMLSIVIFDKDFWGKGIATKAATEFADEVFSKYEIEKLGAFVYLDNLGSIGLLKKAGFREMEEFVEDTETELSYQIMPKWWGIGIGTEVSEAVLNYGFIEMELISVVAETQLKNRASCRLLEKLGMKEEERVERFDEMQVIYRKNNTRGSDYDEFKRL